MTRNEKRRLAQQASGDQLRDRKMILRLKDINLALMAMVSELYGSVVTYGDLVQAATPEDRATHIAELQVRQKALNQILDLLQKVIPAFSNTADYYIPKE